MLNFGASKPRVKGGPPLDPHLPLAVIYVRTERTMGGNEKSCVTDS